jgi:hypothetical protein
MAGKFEGRLLVGALALALAFVRCGGEALTDRAAPDGGPLSTAGTGGDPNASGCDDADAPEAGCGGEGGALAMDARLRTACNLNVNVNRGGQPVSICFHIK